MAIELTIILFNTAMFAATGESDKPSIILKLTEEQSDQIRNQLKKGLDVLSIHPILK